MTAGRHAKPQNSEGSQNPRNSQHFQDSSRRGAHGSQVSRDAFVGSRSGTDRTRVAPDLSHLFERPSRPVQSQASLRSGQHRRFEAQQREERRRRDRAYAHQADNSEYLFDKPVRSDRISDASRHYQNTSYRKDNQQQRSSESRQPFPQSRPTRTVQDARSAQAERNVRNIRAPQEVRNIQNAQVSRTAQNVPSVQTTQRAQNARNAQNTQSARSVRNIQNAQVAQNAQRMRSVQQCSRVQEQIDKQNLSRYSYVPPKRKRTHKVAWGVGIGVLVIILVAVGFAASYILHLDSVMNLGDRKDSIDQVLEPAPFAQPFYVLLVGSDSREGSENSDYEWAGVSKDGSDEHADVVMVARVDTIKDQVTLLSIPRDTPWTFFNGTLGKLNGTYTAGGIPYLARAVNDLTGLPLSHVVEIHMSGLIELVDLIGGIEVNVPIRIEYHEALTSQDVIIEPGLQTLNGVQTEVFVRERLSFADGDVSRQSNVRMIIEAILKKIKNAPLTELPGLVASLAECVDTDLSTLDLLQLLTLMGGDIKMYQGTAPNAGGQNPNTTPPDQWLCFEDTEGWNRVLEVVKSGGDPGTVSYEGDETFEAKPAKYYLPLNE